MRFLEKPEIGKGSEIIVDNRIEDIVVVDHRDENEIYWFHENSKYSSHCDVRRCQLLDEKEYYTAWNGEKRKWSYTKEEKPVMEVPLACYDCNIPYSAIGDCAIPNDIWNKIQPRPNTPEWKGCGILCANCIIERLHHLDIYGVEAKLW